MVWSGSGKVGRPRTTLAISAMVSRLCCSPGAGLCRVCVVFGFFGVFSLWDCEGRNWYFNKKQGTAATTTSRTAEYFRETTVGSLRWETGRNLGSGLVPLPWGAWAPPAAASSTLRYIFSFVNPSIGRLNYVLLSLFSFSKGQRTCCKKKGRTEHFTWTRERG